MSGVDRSPSLGRSSSLGICCSCEGPANPNTLRPCPTSPCLGEKITTQGQVTEIKTAQPVQPPARVNVV